jgi:hypothetical protein
MAYRERFVAHPSRMPPTPAGKAVVQRRPEHDLLKLQALAGNQVVLRTLAAAGRGTTTAPAVQVARAPQGGKTAAPVGDDLENLPLVAGRLGATGLARPKPGATTAEQEPSGPTPRLTKKTVVAPTESPRRNRPVEEPMGGLGYQTQSGPTGGNSGAYKWVVQWKLDNPSPQGGWIVQRVDFKVDAKEADAGTGKMNTLKRAVGVKPMKKVKLQAKFGVDPASLTRYWEAWQVMPGQSVTSYAQNGDVEDDTYAFPSFGPGTKGSVGSVGKAEFYEGLTLPNSFKVTNAAPAWILPLTRSQPKLEGGTGAIPHTLMATWDSTKDGTDDKPDETTKIKTK